jgi:hypothetical protein
MIFLSEYFYNVCNIPRESLPIAPYVIKALGGLKKYVVQPIIYCYSAFFAIMCLSVKRFASHNINALEK